MLNKRERGRKMNKYVVFRVDNQMLGVSITNVEKVLRSINISKLPISNSYVEEVINYQNEILQLINIKRLFNMPTENVNNESNIIIIKKDESKVGIIVDEVDDIEEVDRDSLKSNMKNKYVEEVVLINNEIVSIISPNIVNIVGLE